MQSLEAIAKISVDCGFHLHRDIGPGLLESVYEILLSESLKEKGLSVERQKIIPITFKGRVLEEAFRRDLVVENQILIELKSTERYAPVHAKQVITYLRLMDLPLGFLDELWRKPLSKTGLKRLAK